MMWSDVQLLQPHDLLPLGTGLHHVADQASECREAQPDFDVIFADFEGCLLGLQGSEEKYQIELGESRIAQQALLAAELDLRRLYSQVRGRFVIATDQGEEYAHLADMVKNFPRESRLRRNALAAKAKALLHSADAHRASLAGIGLPAALDRLAVGLDTFHRADLHREVESSEDKVAAATRTAATAAARTAIRRLIVRLELDGNVDTMARLAALGARHLPTARRPTIDGADGAAQDGELDADPAGDDEAAE
jgi:hypothetical protein